LNVTGSLRPRGGVLCDPPLTGTGHARPTQVTHCALHHTRDVAQRRAAACLHRVAGL